MRQLCRTFQPATSEPPAAQCKRWLVPSASVDAPAETRTRAWSVAGTYHTGAD